MEMKELLHEMQRKPMSLFYGAGVCMGCGGPSGDQLFHNIKQQYPTGTSGNFFDYMNEIIDFDNKNRNEIEALIKKNLLSISPMEDHQYLFSLPWKAILTTNYDRLPNLIPKTMDGRRLIVPVVDPDIHSQIDPSKPDLLFCFKMLGDIDYIFSNGGWMILSSNDLRVTFARRSLFFKMFSSLASTGHVIYLGYSFKDNLVFDLLKEMSFVLKTLPWKGFAVTSDQPNVAILKKMQDFGITWVKGTLEEFIEQAKAAFGKIPTSATSIVNSFSVHNFVMQLERATVDNTWRKYKVFDSTLLDPFSKEPKYFFEGVDKSFYPFVAGWDFPRRLKKVWLDKQNPEALHFDINNFVRKRTQDGNSSHNIIVSLAGSAGSGKTVVTKRISFDWYRSGNPVIFIEPALVIDRLSLDGLLDEIWEKYRSEVAKINQLNPKPLRFLVIVDECGFPLEQLVELQGHLKSIGKPVDILLATRTSDIPLAHIIRSGVDIVLSIDDTITPEEWGEFRDHFEDLKAIENIEQLMSNLNDKTINSSFFALMFTTVRGVQKPLRVIITEEFESLDISSRNYYAMVALLQSQMLKPLVSLTLSSGKFDRDWLDLQITKGRLGGILRYEQGGFEISTSNRIIAEIVSNVAYKTTDQVFSALKRFVGAVNLGNKLELNLLHMLLIDRLSGELGGRLKPEQKMDLFNDAVNIVRSRPLLLHLAMLQMRSDKIDKAGETLKEAFDAHVADFDEPEQHVFDAKGRLELRIAESAKDKPVKWEHLEKAETCFYDAQINPSSTPHPYQGLGKTYLEKAKIADDNSTKWLYLLLVMQECSYSENYLGGEFNAGINSLKKEALTLLESEKLDFQKITQINNQIGQGAAYAFLAELAIKNCEPKKALRLVEEGLSADPKSIWLIRLHVQLLTKEDPDNLEGISKALEDYVRLSDKRFDVPLSFALAIATFKKGDFGTAIHLFEELNERTKHHPMRLTQSPENRWMEKGQPKEFLGNVIEPATYGKYGKIECSTLPGFDRMLEFGLRDAESSFHGGEKVSFGIIFNMVGPQASRVRKFAF